MGDGLTITGGANGLAARFDDLRAQASLLDAIASDLAEVASTLARLTVSSDIAEAAVLCPFEAAEAEEAILAANVGPHGAGVAWARAEASVAFVRFSVAAYQEIDAALSRAGDELAFAGGFAAGSIGVPALAASVVQNPVLAAVLWANRRRLGDAAQEIAYDQPWTQEVAARTAPGAVQGGFNSLLGGSPVLLGLISGGHWPTSDLQGAVQGLLAVAGPTGRLKDSGEFTAVATGPRRALNFGPSNFVGKTLNEQVLLSKAEATVQVIAVDGPSGPSYIVQIPGTQRWAFDRNENPADLVSNVNLVAGRRTALADAVVNSMRAAHIPPQAPVMLTGHSQGGMVAAAMAADAECRGSFNITAVVTAGSPIGEARIPASVAVLSLESIQDLVPKLDGADNPDRPNWTTVRRDLSDGTLAVPGRDVVAAHSISNYRQVGEFVDRADDAALAKWRRLVAEFFGAARAQRYSIAPQNGG